MATKKQTQEVPATLEEQREILLADLLEKKAAYEDAFRLFYIRCCYYHLLNL